MEFPGNILVISQEMYVQCLGALPIINTTYRKTIHGKITNYYMGQCSMPYKDHFSYTIYILLSTNSDTSHLAKQYITKYHIARNKEGTFE